MAANLFTISREEAASQLGMSTRTLDRWLKSGKLKSKTDGRTVWISEKSLAEAVKKVGKKQSIKSQSAPAERLEASFTMPVSEEKVFQKLYEETASELKAKQEKLEAAGFRVGQLEAQLQNSVPLLEYRQREEELRIAAEQAKDKLNSLKLQNNLLVAGVIALAAAAVVFGVLLLR
jgi:excisionase family DNA binding protein